MSFNEYPVVDENSKISEESELAVRLHFNRRSGFVLRMETPDYGCDAMLELIIEPDGASGKKVPVQIKSSAGLSFVTISEKAFLSLSFATSRLGYLCNHAPAFGLILVYDDRANTCYFDYVDEIVNRINTEKGNDEWKQQKTVNIHIPKVNVLNLDAVRLIHQNLTNRFDALDRLLQKFGARYDIPHFSPTNSADNQPKLTAAELLLKYSAILMEDYDMLRMYQLLAQVSMHEITTSKELIFLATIVYSEVGKCVEADFYLAKSQQIISQFTVEEKEVLKFTRIKVDFLLGRRSKEEFYHDFKTLQAVTQLPMNALQIKINLAYYEVLEKISANEFDEKTEKNLFALFDEIEGADLSQRRSHLFKIFHAENIDMYITSRMLKFVHQMRLREILQQQVSEEERFSNYYKGNEQTSLLIKIVVKALHHGKKTDDKFLMAHAQHLLSRFFFTRQYDYLLLNFKEDRADLRDNFRMSFLWSLVSHNLFLSLGLLKEARNALLNAYELQRLAKIWYGFDITEGTEGEEGLLRNIKASENEMGLNESYTSIVDAAFGNLKENISEVNGEYFKNFTDTQIGFFATNVLEVYGLPADRHIHLVNEMKAFRFFYRHCETNNFVLLCDLRPHQHQTTKYASPTKYKLVSKVTGLESPSSTNVEELAKAFGALKANSK